MFGRVDNQLLLMYVDVCLNSSPQMHLISEVVGRTEFYKGLFVD